MSTLGYDLLHKPLTNGPTHSLVVVHVPVVCVGEQKGCRIADCLVRVVDHLEVELGAGVLTRLNRLLACLREGGSCLGLPAHPRHLVRKSLVTVWPQLRDRSLDVAHGQLYLIDFDLFNDHLDFLVGRHHILVVACTRAG